MTKHTPVWKKEIYPHLKRMGNIGFWRNRHTSGFVEISKIEDGAPGRSRGKYIIGINTPKHLDTSFAKTLENAKSIAKKYMKLEM